MNEATIDRHRVLERRFPEGRLFLLRVNGEVLRIARRGDCVIFRGPPSFAVGGVPCRKRAWARVALAPGESARVEAEGLALTVAPTGERETPHGPLYRFLWRGEMRLDYGREARGYKGVKRA